MKYFWKTLARPFALGVEITHWAARRRSDKKFDNWSGEDPETPHAGEVGWKDKFDGGKKNWQSGNTEWASQNSKEREGPGKPDGEKKIRLNGSPLELILRGDFLIYRAKTRLVSVATPRNTKCYVTQGWFSGAPCSATSVDTSWIYQEVSSVRAPK